MDMYGEHFTADRVLNEQVARHIFGLMGEDGPLLIIMDNAGNCRPSDSHRYAGLDISESCLREFRSKIDDGYEPLVTERSNCTIVASQLATERTNFGYIMIVFENRAAESAINTIDMVELMLSQFNLIAALIEKNNSFVEMHSKHLGACGDPVAQLN